MTNLLSILLLFSAFARADPADAPLGSSPEQYPGQLAEMRLAALYPVLSPLPPRPPAAAAEERLDAYLEDTETVLKNLRGLGAYLNAGLKDPRALGRPHPQWDGAWTALDAELDRLRPLLDAGEALRRGPVPEQRRFGPPRKKAVLARRAARYPTEQGRRLHRAEEWIAYAANQRALLLLESQPAGSLPGRDGLARAAEALTDRARRQASVDAPPK